MAYDDFGAAAAHFVLPQDLDEAVAMIKSLRNQLLQANIKRAEAFEKAETNKRSLLGEFKALKRQQTASQGSVQALAVKAVALLKKARDNWTCAGITKNQELADLLAEAEGLGL